MNILQRIARAIIKKSFQLSVRFIEAFHDVSIYDDKTEQLRKLPEGTLGKSIANCLTSNRLRLVPKYESHDLKHVLLNYEMTPVDEIRLQAFMIGNGNYSIPSFAIFVFGAVLLPDLWSTFYADYKKGKKAKPISSWTIEEYADCNVAELRARVFDYVPQAQPSFSLAALIKPMSYSAIIIGALGMCYCLPFLFSSSLIDVVGAGFPFLAGAIIASAGLLALSKQAAGNKPQNVPVLISE